MSKFLSSNLSSQVRELRSVLKERIEQVTIAGMDPQLLVSENANRIYLGLIPASFSGTFGFTQAHALATSKLTLTGNELTEFYWTRHGPLCQREVWADPADQSDWTVITVELIE